MDWTEQASCKDHNPELFHPVSVRSIKSYKQTQKAIEICKTCPVRQACYDYADSNEEEWGVWGGINFLERNKLFARHLPNLSSLDNKNPQG